MLARESKIVSFWPRAETRRWAKWLTVYLIAFHDSGRLPRNIAWYALFENPTKLAEALEEIE